MNLDVPSQVNQIKIKGKDCSDSESTNYTIVNKSNGFTGTVFSTPKKSFKTDLIQLSPGKNLIILTALGESGESNVSEIRLNRKTQ